MPRFKLPNNARQAGFIVVLILAAGTIGYSIANHSKNSNGSNNSSSTTQTTVAAPAYKAIKYPDKWVEDQQISGQQNKLNVLSSASRTAPNATAFVRVQDGKLASDFDINKSSDEIVQSLSREIEDFSLVDKKVIKAGDYNSIQIRYKQLDDQYILVVIPRPDKAFYLTVRAKASDFEKINGEVDSIIKSLASYIASKG